MAQVERNGLRTGSTVATTRTRTTVSVPHWQDRRGNHPEEGQGEPTDPGHVKKTTAAEERPGEGKEGQDRCHGTDH